MSKVPRVSKDPARRWRDILATELDLQSSESSSVLPFPSPESKDSLSPDWFLFLMLGARPILVQLERRLPQLLYVPHGGQGELRMLA